MRRSSSLDACGIDAFLDEIGFRIVGARGGRNRARYQALRVIDENSGRGSGGGANDSSARGIRRRWDNARERDCSGIGEQRVAVDAGEDHRIVRECARQRVVGREFLGRPSVLIPSSPENPLARLDIFSPGSDARDDLVIRHRAGEIHPLQRGAESEEVRVRVSQSWYDRGAVEVDDGRGRSGERPGFGKEPLPQFFGNGKLAAGHHLHGRAACSKAFARRPELAIRRIAPLRRGRLAVGPSF